MPPTVALALLLTTAYASAFHLVVGRNMRQLAVSLLASLAGFVIGHAAGATWGPNLQLAGLFIVHASLSSWAAMAVARRLVG
jgi:hypothetical protein